MAYLKRTIMKLDKKKIVFGIVILLVVLFMVTYSLLFLTDGTDTGTSIDQPMVPALTEQPKEYTSKLEAIDDLKEERNTNAPSIYGEQWTDTTLRDIEKDKMRIVDSIYSMGRIQYTGEPHTGPLEDNTVEHGDAEIEEAMKLSAKPMQLGDLTPQEMALEQQLFFASAPKRIASMDRGIVAMVQRTQTVRAHDRLEFRLLGEVVIDGRVVPAGTRLFGIVGFQPNRMLLDISNMDHIPVKLKAYDYRDGLEGLYIKNTFRAELSREMMDDVVDDINVPGIPQVRGLKNIFKRSNRKVRATVNKNYKILLKIKP